MLLLTYPAVNVIPSVLVRSSRFRGVNSYRHSRVSAPDARPRQLCSTLKREPRTKTEVDYLSIGIGGHWYQLSGYRIVEVREDGLMRTYQRNPQAF